MRNEQTNKHNGQGHWVHADRRGEGGGEGAGAQTCLPAPSALAPEAVGHASVTGGTGEAGGDRREVPDAFASDSQV